MTGRCGPRLDRALLKYGLVYFSSRVPACYTIPGFKDCTDSCTHTLCINSDLAGLTRPSTMVQAQSSDGDEQVEVPVGVALELIIDAPSGAATSSRLFSPV